MKPRLACAVVALALLSGCKNGSPSARPSPEPTPSRGLATADDRCVRRPHFRPTSVPKGWHRRLQPGDGGGGADYPGLIGHYGGKGLAGTRAGAVLGFADVVVKYAPGQSNRTRIEVLGSTGSIGDVHEGYSVEFSYEDCDYALVAYGIDRPEVASVARGLQPTK